MTGIEIVALIVIGAIVCAINYLFAFVAVGHLATEMKTAYPKGTFESKFVHVFAVIAALVLAFVNAALDAVYFHIFGIFAQSMEVQVVTLVPAMFGAACGFIICASVFVIKALKNPA